MSATGHRPLSRPGRGPRRARPVHGQGAGPGPRGSIKIRRAGRSGPWPGPGLFKARHGRPPRSGARSGERSPDRRARPDVLNGRALTRSIRGRRRQGASSGPGAAVDAIPPPRTGRGASTGGSEPTGHDAAAGRTRGIRPPARPRPHGKNDQTTIKPERRDSSECPPTRLDASRGTAQRTVDRGGCGERDETARGRTPPRRAHAPPPPSRCRRDA